MTAKLVAEEGAEPGKTLLLENDDQWVIGRDPDECQLVIEDPAVSRKHLVCRATPEGFWVENLSESNPTLLNGEELTTPRLLKQGDSLTIGLASYRFQENDEAAFEEPLIEETPLPAVEEEAPYDTIYDDASPKDPDYLADINFDLTESGRWLLKVIGGPNTGAEFSMHSSSVYALGTDPNVCDIVFHDTSVSRQHARISISSDDIISIEDLKSRNGSSINGSPIEGRHILEPNAVVSLGTTSFVLYDREGEMQTIIAPLLPALVKTLQKEETSSSSTPLEREEKETPSPLVSDQTALAKPAEKTPPLGALILLAGLIGLFVLTGIGITSLFRSEPIQIQQPIDIDKQIQTALEPFPTLRYAFNKSTGKLLLLGHVLTAVDRNQLLYNLQGIPFIKSIDDSGLYIDEGFWREMNQLLSKNPNWKGITLYAPAPGKFVLSGYLQTRKQAEQLWEYMNANFPFLDLIERKVLVEEEALGSITTHLLNHGIKNVKAQISNGDVVLTGLAAANQAEALQAAIEEIKGITGIRSVRSDVGAQAPEQSLINVTDRYEVTGFSHQGGVNTNVVINGRILARGDILDGMTITSIQPQFILLEKEGIKYRIDYNR